MFYNVQVYGAVVKETNSANEPKKQKTEVPTNAKNMCNHKNSKKDRLQLPNWYYCHDCKTPFDNSKAITLQITIRSKAKA